MDFTGGKLPKEILDCIWRFSHIQLTKELNKEFEKYFTPRITFYDDIPKEKYTKPSWFKFWIDGYNERKKILDDLSYWRTKRKIVISSKDEDYHTQIVYQYTSEEYIIREDQLMDV